MLDLSSKTLPCLHSFCRSCIEMILEENGPCPQCQEPVTSDDLRLSPFLEKTLRRRQLESSEWGCGRCFEENGRESTVQIWCQECDKLLCQSCESFHSGHVTKDLSGMSRGEAVRVITTDDCRRHSQSKDAFCQRCNTCRCKKCYKEHVIASPQCPPRPLSVRDEASNEKIRSPTLERQLRQFEINIRAMSRRTKQSIDKLSTDCESECLKLTRDFEAFVDEARLKLAELCDNMKVMAYELQTKWRHSLKEKENVLKKVEIWHHTLKHLSRGDADDEDVVSGLKLVRAELSARLRQSFAPQEKGRWLVTFPKWCHDSLESLKKEIIVWAAETSGYLQVESECRLQGSNPLVISSIVAGDEDNRVFVGDFVSGSILEFISDSGEMVSQCPLKGGGKEFFPLDMCRLTGDILLVCGLELSSPSIHPLPYYSMKTNDQSICLSITLSIYHLSFICLLLLFNSIVLIYLKFYSIYLTFNFFIYLSIYLLLLLLSIRDCFNSMINISIYLSFIYLSNLIYFFNFHLLFNESFNSILSIYFGFNFICFYLSFSFNSMILSIYVFL
ncbi:unnamed protein product [Acanthosepion pharaonis]|uniref:Uncharacterized protein n=1 Tax=Acanthosepion pharaonis TaxID=158019 RepID=A0A812DKD1_ACAPH|nr:unnamed protein product [Sepia pharaonis]